MGRVVQDTGGTSGRRADARRGPRKRDSWMNSVRRAASQDLVRERMTVSRLCGQKGDQMKRLILIVTLLLLIVGTGCLRLRHRHHGPQHGSPAGFASHE